MKQIILIFTFLITVVITVAQTKPVVKNPATTAKTASSKFGALAIDRSNGFYYGFSYDQPTLKDAEQRAIQESNKRGGKGTVVLTWSGEGCAAYRTIAGNNVSNAFGWGLAKTKEEADIIATKECLKRSNGKTASNFVWACNSNTNAALKTIKNDLANFKPVAKAYGVDENGTGYIKVGDKIILSTTTYRYKSEIIPGELFLFQLRGDENYYKYINNLCVVDKNGIQQTFGGEMYFEMIETFLPYDINKNEGKDFGWGLVTVKDFTRKDKRFGASFHGDNKEEIENAMAGWTGYKDNKEPNNFSNVYNDKLILTDKGFIEKETRNGFYCVEQYRNADQRTYFKTAFNDIPLQNK